MRSFAPSPPSHPTLRAPGWGKHPSEWRNIAKENERQKGFVMRDVTFYLSNLSSEVLKTTSDVSPLILHLRNRGLALEARGLREGIRHRNRLARQLATRRVELEGPEGLRLREIQVHLRHEYVHHCATVQDCSPLEVGTIQHSPVPPPFLPVFL